MPLTNEQEEALKWAIKESETALKLAQKAFDINPNYEPYQQSVKQHTSNLKGFRELLAHK